MAYSDYLAEATRRAEARGDFALARALSALPAAACNDPATYRALVRPVADAVRAADPDFAAKSEPAAIRAELDKP